MDISIEHNGNKYVGEIGTIERTDFGYEGHGILSASISLDFGTGGHQAFGGYALDRYDDNTNKRVPVAYGLKWLVALMEAVGVRQWESLKGAKVIALRESSYGSILGVADIFGKNVFIASELNAD